MHILYFIMVKIIEWLLPVYAFFSGNKKIRQFAEGRRNLFEKLRLDYHPNRYWFHCASLGEFEQARPVIEKLKEKEKDISIVISFFSPSGYEQRKKYDLAEAVFYLPLDTPSNAKRLINAVRPKAVVFVKYEIWYFLLRQLFRQEIPVYLISANFRRDQAIFSIWGKWLFRLLPRYKQIFLQNESSLKILEGHGLKNIALSGDTRYDRVLQNRSRVKENEKIASFKAEKPLLILGSSWPAEEDLLLHSYEEIANKHRYKVIIAPHEISERHISELLNKFKRFNPLLYTGMKQDADSTLLILDTIGHLSGAYRYADIALIGGGFTGQLHNILEPLAFGVPVITGPIHHKFPEAELAKKAGVLFEIEKTGSLNSKLNSIELQGLKVKAESFISGHAGATDIVVDTILQFH